MLTLGMYVGAVALAYDLFRRCSGAVTGIVAAVLFASLNVFVAYSYFVRTETLGLVLCLAAIWIVLYSGWRGTPAIYWVAGVLAGVATAARFHFAFVGFPVILLIFFLQDRARLPAPEWSRYRALYWISGALGVLAIAGGLETLVFKAKLVAASGLTDTMMLTTRSGPAEYADAKATVAALWFLLGFGSAAILAAHAFPRARRRIWPAVNPFTLLATLGFVAGFVLSHPEFLWRGEYQLRSIQFYSNDTDPGLLRLGPITSWWKVSAYYFTSAFPERWVQVLFVAGIAAILWRRRPVALALAGGAALCFCAQPLHMKLWPHHVIPWLPLLCFVAAAPAGLAGSWLIQRFHHGRLAAVAAVVLASAAVVWACAPRLQREDRFVAVSKTRTDRIMEMDRWLSKNVPRDAYVLVSFSALNEDGVREMIEGSGVRVPDFVTKRRKVRIWWLERSSVDGHAGVVCVSRADIAYFRDDLERKHPGSTYNPFEDRGFQSIARFGAGSSELGVFQFDRRSKHLAFGKSATQSSTLGGGDASNAVDGMTDGNFFGGSVSHTNPEANPWWQVDLGAPATIGSLVIWNRTGCCGDRLKDFWVFVSAAPFQPDDKPANLQNRPGTWHRFLRDVPSPSVEVSLGAFRGRYVRIQLGGEGVLSLAEVEVHGNPQ
jgi:hypothetical protein